VPIYDYICGVCGQRTEVIHGINAPSPQFCPACGAEGSLRKGFVAPTVHFKGSGWAKKDRSTANRSTSKPDGESATAEASDGTDKARSKPDGEKGTPKDGGDKKAASSGGASGTTSSAGPAADAGKSSTKAAGPGTD
jgi:putative FmdB family regulatory protein